ncbi:quaternary ammonium compound-resistance protein SugE [Formivibrio citricus]|uniref:Guanidinium exporter n=1 Tax=Formivibrio citricus TaxID=83765 RepID=A0A1I4V441_9NEIS|nr:multidrug efflux SMR transporter [Formivibrio citricus]SFM95750.1 quaternary ammonium compound-resistance protein SugE [Formivibrio citricus]
MAWTFLIIAGLLEIGWPIGLKLGWTDSGLHVLWVAFAILCIIMSGALLLFAQRTIPMGTAYAVWTGIGAAGTFIVGIVAFGDAVSSMRLISAGLIIVGVIGLKFS